MPFDVRCTVKGSVSDWVVVSKWVAGGQIPRRQHEIVGI